MGDIKALFGRRVRKIREDKCISQEKLAALAGLDRTYISKIERGERNVTLEVVERLSSALGIRPCELFEEDDRIRR